MHRILLLLALVLWPAASYADQRASYRRPDSGETIVIEVRDDGDSRIEWSGQPWYLTVLKDEAYVVYDLPAGKTVTRVRDLEQLMRERGVASAPKMDMLRQGLLVERGTASFAGHSGTAYYLKTAAGESTRPAMVISHERALAPLVRPLVRQFDFSLVTIRLAGAEPPPTLLLIRQLLDTGAPLLLAGFALEKVETAPLPAARFTLPGPPKTLDELRRQAAAAKAGQ